VRPERIKVAGQPNPDKISTSYVEREHLNVRMGNRRFTRPTNAFSKT
jgi:IS1 family transposase